MTKIWVAVGFVLMTALVIALSLPGEGWIRSAKSVRDCATIAMLGQEARGRGDLATASYRAQEAEVCWGAQKASPSPSPFVTPSPSFTIEPPAPPPPPEPDPPRDRYPRQRQWEYLANRPVEQKTSANAYGPRWGLTINKNLDDMSVEEALDELRHRLSIDPMLTAATGEAFGLWSRDEVNRKTRLFTDDHAAWDAANERIERRIERLYRAGDIKIVTLQGYYTASWAIPVYSDIPSVRHDMDVWRSGQEALVIGNVTLQLQCGFQEYWSQDRKGKNAAPEGSEAMPDPSPGMDRDDDGNPIVA